MNIQNNIAKPKPADDFIRLQDLFYLCLNKWYWFVISLAITLGAAVAYLLTTPPVYTRSASLLIKEDSKGNSMNDAAGVLGDMNLFQTNTNVNNEIQSLQSPSVMLDVVKRLHLDINYYTDGGFYKKVLYGQSCPYAVTFNDLQNNESVAFTILPGQKGQVKLADFSHNGEEVEGSVMVMLNESMDTPVGKLTVKAANDSAAYEAPVYVSRIGYQAATGAYAANLSVALNDEKSTVVNLSFTDVCIQRAEDVLNTIIAVYNENWIRDKNQIAVSTSAFISDRLGVIEQELGNVDEDISSYKSEHLLPDVQAAASMYMAQSSETNAQILDLNNRLYMTRYIRDHLANEANRYGLLPAAGTESSSIESQISEYNTLLLQRNNLVASSSTSNPIVVDMDQSLDAMRRAIITSLDNHMIMLQNQLSTLQSTEQKATDRIAATPDQAKYLLSVERQQKVKEALYLFLLQKREENELSQAFTAYNTRIITPPTGSGAPTAPVKKNILLVAIALGILVPVVVVFALESSNTKVRGRKDVEGLSMPFIGEIPLYGKRKSTLQKLAMFFRKRNTRHDDEESHILVKEGSRNMINEAFRVLRTNLEFMARKDGHTDVTVVTSFNPGSGKTFITMNLRADSVTGWEGGLRATGV